MMHYLLWMCSIYLWYDFIGMNIEFLLGLTLVGNYEDEILLRGLNVMTQDFGNLNKLLYIYIYKTNKWIFIRN